MLAVDTGGGRLDTHARAGTRAPGKQEKSASWLVAEDLGIMNRPELSKLLEFVRLQETRGRSIASRIPMDHLVSLPNLIRGLNLCHPREPQRVTDIMMALFDAAHATELDWIRAEQDFKSALRIRLSNKTSLVAVVSASTGAVKVARLHKADLVVHRDARGHTGVTMRTKGRLGEFDLEPLAEVVRLAEAVVAGRPIPADRLRDVGMAGGWYLHDSGRILSKGSPKNRSVEPSLLPVDLILGLAAAILEPERGMPAALCRFHADPDHACDTCPFLPLALDACQCARDAREPCQSGHEPE